MKKNRLHQLASQSHSQMMSYIIETDDGKIIVVDGGMKPDVGYLLDYLDGLTNAGGGVIRIDCWILTHVHDDHIDAFMDIMTNHRDRVDIGTLMYKFPPAEMTDIYETKEAHTGHEFDVIKPSLTMSEIFTDDMVFDVGNAHFEVLYTPDFKITNNYVNNTSTVIKMTLGGKTVLFLGDLGVEAGRILLEKNGGKLKSDYCQMAHHGQNGVEKDVYEAIAPKVCLWTAPLWLWDNDAGKGFNTGRWKTVTTRGWMDELGVKTHCVIKDGTQVIEL